MSSPCAALTTGAADAAKRIKAKVAARACMVDKRMARYAMIVV